MPTAPTPVTIADPRKSTPQRSGIDTPRADEMPPELVRYWDERIRRDFAKVRKHHGKWSANKALVENEPGKFGNLASDFVGMLHMRVLQEELGVRIKADDTRDADAVRNAENAEIIAQAVTRISDLRLRMRGVTVNASWASFGVLKVGHPADEHSLEYMQTFKTTNVSRPDAAALVDDYEEVDPSYIAALGGAPEEVRPLDPAQYGAVRERTVRPAPIINPHLGFPWVEVVDPRMIVMPESTVNESTMPYVTELMFLTEEELRVLYPTLRLPDNIHNASQYADLFKETQSEGELSEFPHMLLVAYTYIIRDRNNPHWNNRLLVHVLGRPEDGVIIDVRNPYDGMNRFVFLRPDVTRPMYCRTLAEELAPYTDIHHNLIRAISRDTARMARRVTLIGAGAGIDATARANLEKDGFDGVLDVADPNQIMELFKDQKVDEDKIRALLFFRSLVQTRSRQSDLDLGTAVRNITANQVNALVDATGYNVRAFINEISRAAREIIVKMMEMVARYSHIVGRQQYAYEGRLAVLDRGAHDFKTSMFYDIKVIDSADELEAEQRITWVQLLKLIGSVEQLKVQYDWKALAQRTNEKFGEDRDSLLVRPAAAGSGPGTDPLSVDPAAGAAVAPGAFSTGQMVPGVVGSPQHPERGPGDQGVPDVGNLLRGQAVVGTGLGDEAT